MSETLISKIIPRYHKVRTLYLGSYVITNELLKPGEEVMVTIEGDEEFAEVGKLYENALLTGMANLYSHLNLKEGMEVKFRIADDTENLIVITEPKTALSEVAEAVEGEESEEPEEVEEGQTVFERDNLKHVHLEVFRPENLKEWTPETEPDVYLVFGVLQEFTDYKYCCGASKSILTKLGANYDERSNPDAILIDRRTGGYLMAEWKKYSADFKVNHKPEDVDVLICWIDNEADRSSMPPQVLALNDIARTAATDILGKK